MPTLRERKNEVNYSEKDGTTSSRSKAQSTRKPKEPKRGPPKMWSLPFEITLLIFEELDRPPVKDVNAYKTYQSDIAQLCLICKSTVSPARSILLKSPAFDYQRHNNHRARVCLLDAMEAAEKGDLGESRLTRSFTYVNYPSAPDTRLSRTSLLESIIDTTRLTCLSIWQTSSYSNNDHLRRAMPLEELRSAFRNARSNMAPLQHLCLRDVEISRGDFTAAFIELISLPALRHLKLKLQLSTVESIPDPTISERQAIESSNLQYLYLDRGWDDSQPATAVQFLKILPPSLTTLAMIKSGHWVDSSDAKIWSHLPHLKHLAIGVPAEELKTIPLSYIHLLARPVLI